MAEAGTALQPVKPMDRFRSDLTLREDMIKALLPKAVPFQKFFQMMVAAAAANPKLLECDRGSLVKSAIQAAELGLSLNPTLGEGDILPVYDGREKKYVAQFRPRYMGLMKLARQSGEVLKIEAEIVREGDDFVFEKGSEPRLEHRIKLGNRGEMIGAYCVWTLKNGEKQFEVMDRDQIIAIRDRSSAKTKEGKIVGPWSTDPEEMWRKTVVRRASKYMPRSCEGFVNAVAADNLQEAGHEIDITDGEVIDLTADEPIIEELVEMHPNGPGATQVNNLASKVAKRSEQAEKPVTLLDVPVDEDGLSDWQAWCEQASAVVKAMSDARKAAWAEKNRALLDEAQLMAPEAVESLLNALG